MIKNANFFVLIVLRLRTHQRKKFTITFLDTFYAVKELDEFLRH